MKHRKKKLKQQLQLMEKASLRHEAQHKARKERWVKHEYSTEPASAMAMDNL